MAAVFGLGSSVTIGSTGFNAGVIDINITMPSYVFADTTSMATTGARTEARSPLYTAGAVEITYQWDPEATTTVAPWTVGVGVVTITVTGPGGATWAANGAYESGSAELTPEGIMTGRATFRLVDDITHTP